MAQVHHSSEKRNLRQRCAHLTKIANAASAVRAELIGSNRATALDIEAHGSSPVLALCRALVEAGHDPRRPLDFYRGDVLALRVRSIGEGAKLTVRDNSAGKPVFRRWDGAPIGAEASPMLKNLEAVGGRRVD